MNFISRIASAVVNTVGASPTRKATAASPLSIAATSVESTAPSVAQRETIVQELDENPEDALLRTRSLEELVLTIREPSTSSSALPILTPQALQAANRSFQPKETWELLSYLHVSSGVIAGEQDVAVSSRFSERHSTEFQSFCRDAFLALVRVEPKDSSSSSASAADFAILLLERSAGDVVRVVIYHTYPQGMVFYFLRAQCAVVWNQALNQDESRMCCVAARWNGETPSSQIVAFQTAWSKIAFELARRGNHQQQTSFFSKQDAKDGEANAQMREDDAVQWILQGSEVHHPTQKQHNEEEDQARGQRRETRAFKQTIKERSKMLKKISGGGHKKKAKQADDEDEEDATATNRHLLVGMTSGRAFVSQGGRMGAFAQDQEGELHWQTNLDFDKIHRAPSNPSVCLLHEADNKILMLSPNDPTQVCEMDIEYQQVVQTFGVSDGFHIQNIAPVSKYAQSTGEERVLAINRTHVFELDKRQNGKNKLATKREYQTPAHFSAMATDRQERRVVGSHTGEIRFFGTDLTLPAKTKLPGLGDAIIGLDITTDSKYVLATTRTYLLIIDSEGAFTSSITGSAPPPRKLQLHPQDIARYNIHSLCFTPAKFNAGNTSATDREEFIASSTGALSIVWDFARVLRGDLFAYSIKVCRDQVVANQFFFNQTDNLAFSLKHNVFSEKLRSAMVID